MLKHIRNILILIIAIAIGAGFYLMRGDTARLPLLLKMHGLRHHHLQNCVFAACVRGDTARLPLEATAGVDPQLTDVRKENFPTINGAEAVPWQDGEGPVAAGA